MVIRAFGFLTMVGRSTPPDGSTLEWFPLVGAIVGLAVGGVWFGAEHLWPRGPAAALAVAADLAITGMLHFDGLTDTADGVLPHMDRARRLSVMSEPTIGAFGLVVAVTVLLLRWTSFAVITPNVLLIAGIWCASRTVMAVTVRIVPYARDGGGLAARFIGTRRWITVGATGALASFGLGILADRGIGALAIGVVFLTGAAVVAFCRKRLGGFTGDVLGAAGLLAETMGLLLVAAKW
jgi:adenosylcobinamide-GDP ribazoletransferase